MNKNFTFYVRLNPSLMEGILEKLLKITEMSYTIAQTASLPKKGGWKMSKVNALNLWTLSWFCTQNAGYQGS